MWERSGRRWERVLEDNRGCVDGLERVREDERLREEEGGRRWEKGGRGVGEGEIVVRKGVWEKVWERIGEGGRGLGEGGRKVEEG